MIVNYYYPYWGSASIPFKTVMSTVLENGFDGIEIDLPNNREVIDALLLHQENGIKIIGQQVLRNEKETPKEYLKRALDRLEELKVVKPDFINSHTGKDHFDFEANCMIISELEEWSEKNNIPIMHETHRGRFSFHANSILPYLDRFPTIELVGDLSHWCTVSESLLEDQEGNVQKVIPFIHHLHARVGWSQAAQVNDPFANEWSETMNQFLKWWQMIVGSAKSTGKDLGITPEFGPYPYMPETPYDRKPLADQKEINLKMKSLLQEVLHL